MSGLVWVVLGALGGLGMAMIGDMVSEEVRDRLDHLPHAILRLAARRLDPTVRSSLYDEVWLPDLAYHLKGDEARPVTRLYHGTCFAVGMLASARRSARNLNGVHPQDTVTPLPDTQDAVASVIDTAKAVAAPFRQPDWPWLDTSISGNRLLVRGEIEVSTEKSLRAAMLTFEEVPETTLILDLTDVRFMDVKGLHAVVDFVEKLEPPRQLILVCNPRVAHVFMLGTKKQERATWPLKIGVRKAP